MEKQKKGKSLKKPIVFGAMLALLTLVGVTGSQTYAKYVSSKTTGAQSATVAKWGYVVSADADGLFGTMYNDTGIVDEVDGAAVKAGGSYDVLAPGCKGSLTISISGNAEVLANYSFTLDTANDISIADKETPAHVYYPLKWTLTVDGVKAVDGQPLSAVKTELADSKYKNQPLAAAQESVNKTIKLEYVWPMTQALTTTSVLNLGTADNLSDTLTSDECDTLMGQFAASKNGTETDKYTIVKQCSVSLTASVTQVKS